MKIFYCLTLLLLWTSTAEARVNYAVTIPVEVNAEDSVKAKDKAMLEAQRTAFLQIAGQLTSAENVAKLAQLSDNALLHFIQSVGVAGEKAGGNKYSAELTVQINEQLLKDYMSENEMIKLETVELMVIPIYKPDVSTYPRLWEEDNLWLRHWRSKGLIKFGAMQLRTIHEQLHGLSELSAENALYMNSELYDSLVYYSNSEHIYVVFAEVLSNGDLKITVKDEKNKTENDFTVYNDNSGNIFDQAIEKSVMFISNMERDSQNNADIATVNSINVVYMYQDMKDWLNKSKIIEDLPQVEGVETKSFGGGKVNFSIRYSGAIDDLWASLQENGFSHETAGNYYIIR